MQKKSFLDWMVCLEGQRWPWLAMAALAVSLVLIAHNVFQVWLYMKPCRQCVYIRFGFLVIAFGALFPTIFPKAFWSKVVALVLGLYGAGYGLMCSIKLSNIHHAVHSDDPEALFGMQGCSLEPHYPFSLPLEKWAPDWFLPTGDCGYDTSDVPMDVVLSSAQQWWIDLYSAADGWYLIPPYKFMSMAQCCELGFAVAGLLFVILFAGSVKKHFKKAL